ARGEPMRGLARFAIINWAVSVPEVDGAVAALKSAGFAASPAQPGARLTPSGERLDWTTFGLRDADIGGAPFFIRWSPNTRHPSTTAPGGCSLDRLVVQDPASDRLATAMNALDVSRVAIANGAARIEATLTCGSRRAILTTPQEDHASTADRQRPLREYASHGCPHAGQNRSNERDDMRRYVEPLAQAGPRLRARMYERLRDAHRGERGSIGQ